MALISCNSTSTKKNDFKGKTIENQQVTEREIILKTDTNKVDSFIFGYKKEVINNIEFEAYLKRPENLTIKTSDGKIIYIHEGNPADFEFVDFNGDSFEDIILTYPSNYLFQELLLFNPKFNSFEFVKSFSKYPYPERIGKTNFFYSYQGAGCAQNDWISYLYQLKDTKIIEKGLIHGFGCLQNDSNGIYIYKKTINAENKLLKYIKRDVGYWDGKWVFIEKYWNKNYKMFE